MAQTIDNWKKRILDAKALEPTLAFLNISRASVYNSWAYITAVTISVIDNLIDVFSVEVEERVNKSYVGTKFYIREKVSSGCQLSVRWGIDGTWPAGTTDGYE